MASRPSESGMLASVDARCTAPYAQLRIHGANHFQKPRILRQFACRTIPDLDHFALHHLRLRVFCCEAARFSAATACSSPRRKARSSRSISAIDVERRSTRMLADSGIEFTEVPPRITPTLNVVLATLALASR